jgi:protoporphyrinogen IX oxidase
LPSPSLHGKLATVDAIAALLSMESIDLWIKVVHIVAVISWMAGMLYLPRLFVYHADAERKSATSEQFKVMERRLLKGIVNPAMIAVWTTGPLLAWREGYVLSPWLLAKVALVLLLTGLHGIFAAQVRAFAEDRNVHSSRFYRFINEAPTAIMIFVVFLVVMKP